MCGAALHAAEPEANLPLVRILAHHAQVYVAMQAHEPADPANAARCTWARVGSVMTASRIGHQRWPRDSAKRRRGSGRTPGARGAASRATSLRWSTPAPGGLPGGYPVWIANGAVTLDLPPGLTEQDAIAFNESMARWDGIDRIDADGTVHFTAASRDAVAGLGHGLGEPLMLDDLAMRTAALDAALA